MRQKAECPQKSAYRLTPKLPNDQPPKNNLRPGHPPKQENPHQAIIPRNPKPKTLHSLTPQINPNPQTIRDVGLRRKEARPLTREFRLTPIPSQGRRGPFGNSLGRPLLLSHKNRFKVDRVRRFEDIAF